MNLIEKLGGYEKAKLIVDKSPCKTYTYHNHPYQKGYIRCWGGDGKDYFLVSDIEKALLEYRREHGIFEVGDWVGIKDDSTTWVDKVVSIEYKKIHDSKWNASVTEILVFEDGTKLGVGWAIHATDEEIKAGHRL